MYLQKDVNWVAFRRLALEAPLMSGTLMRMMEKALRPRVLTVMCKVCPSISVLVMIVTRTAGVWQVYAAGKGHSCSLLHLGRRRFHFGGRVFIWFSCFNCSNPVVDVRRYWGGGRQRQVAEAFAGAGPLKKTEKKILLFSECGRGVWAWWTRRQCE